MSIELEGLSKQQVDLLSRMWTMQSQIELEEWRNTLSSDDYKTSVTLEHLVVMEFLEDRIDEHMNVTKNLLKKIFEKK
jgi:hypothetical protein